MSVHRPSNKMKISMIIPAAGLSTRHPDKLLQKFRGYGKETSQRLTTTERLEKRIIETTVSKFIKFPMDIIVIVGHNKDEIESVLRNSFEHHIRIIENPEYRNGLGTSLKAGVLASKSDTDYFGFCLGDKPFVKPETINHLLETLEKQHPPMLAPTFNGVFGHPNFFSKEYRDKFTSLKKDSGGRDILQSERRNVLTIPGSDPGVITDMDIILKNLSKV